MGSVESACAWEAVSQQLRLQSRHPRSAQFQESLLLDALAVKFKRLWASGCGLEAFNKTERYRRQVLITMI